MSIRTPGPNGKIYTYSSGTFTYLYPLLLHILHTSFKDLMKGTMFLLGFFFWHVLAY